MDILKPEDETFLTVANESPQRWNPQTSRSVLGSVEQLRLTAEMKRQKYI